MTQGHHLIEYRNAVYQGGFSKGKRQLKGILIADSGQIFIGSWKNDNLNDRVLIWIDNNTHVIGEYLDGYMDGDFIFRNEANIFYASFNKNKLTGQQVSVEKRLNKATLLEFKNDRYKVIKEISTLGKLQSQILQELLGYKLNFPSLVQYIKKQLLQDDTFICENLNQFASLITFNRCYNREKIGFVINKQFIVSAGMFVDRKLQGLGFKIEDRIRSEGQFKNGILNGFGCKISGTKTVAGYYLNNSLKDLIQIDKQSFELPEIKKNLHIQSIFFFNSYVKATALIRYRGYEQTLKYKTTATEYISHNINSTFQESPIKNIKLAKSVFSEEEQRFANSETSNFRTVAKNSEVRRQLQQSKNPEEYLAQSKLEKDVEQYRDIETLIRMKRSQR